MKQSLNIQGGISWGKRFSRCVVIALFVVLMVGCQQKERGNDAVAIYLTIDSDSSNQTRVPSVFMGNDTISVEKIIVSNSEQDNQTFTHIKEFFRNPKIDFREITNQFQSNTWHAFGILLLWLSIGAIFFLFAWLCWQWVQTIWSKRYRQSFRYRHLGLQIAAYITLISGCILYYVGFFMTGTASSVVAYFIRPFIASLGMFVGNTSYQEVCEECTNSPVYMTLFGIIHIAAIIISAVVVINFFWKRLSSWYFRKLWWIEANVLNRKKPLNIFWGTNEPCFILAKEMKERKEHIVFIDCHSSDANNNQQMSLSQIFGMFPYDNELMRQIRGWQCVVMHTAYNMEKEDNDNEYLLDKLGIGRLRSMIKDSAKTRIFFLSEAAQSNIKTVINIQKDFLFKDSQTQIDIFCHAPRNSHNLALERKFRENENHGQTPAVHIIDSSQLAIQWLKTNPRHHPVQFVGQKPEERKRGVVNDEFNSLIVGFGETGREALAFLYEFGAFVNDNHVRSPFRCYVIDPKINSLKDEFYMKRPALKGNDEIVFVQLSDEKGNYWEQIELLMEKLQYIVVSTGSDENNMKIAIDLYNLAIRCRKNNLSHFKIYVRSYFLRNEQWMEHIANYYNRSNQCSQGEIVVFGKMSDIYNYDNIVLDKVLQEANQYGNKYYEAYQKLEQIVGKDNVQLSGLAAIRKKHRSLSQDIANSLHASTKFQLMGLDEEKLKKLFIVPNLSKDEQEMKNWLIEVRNFSENHAFKFGKLPEKLDGVRLLMYNMVLCEHLRWNAAHEMMGYTYGEEKDEVVKEHDCLTDFSNLPKFSQEPYDKRDYDFLVLETSIKLRMDESTLV